MKKVLFVFAIAMLFIIGCDSNHNKPVKDTELPPVEGQQVTIVEDEDGNIVAAASSVPVQTVKESDIVEEVEAPADETK